MRTRSPAILKVTSVSVTFISPEKFADVGWRRHALERERAGILRELAATMRRAAGEYQRNDLRLEIAVKDIDLAAILSGEGGRISMTYGFFVISTRRE